MVSWTKGHFELIADTVNDEVSDEDTKENLCRSFATRLEVKNDFFDYGKFMTKCKGVEKTGL